MIWDFIIQVMLFSPVGHQAITFKNAALLSMYSYGINTGECKWKYDYRQIFNIDRTLVGNKIIDHSVVVGASPAGAAPTTSSFAT